MILQNTIKNKKTLIEIEIDTTYRELKYMYLDSFENSINYLSEDADDHDFKLNASDHLYNKLFDTAIYHIRASDIDEKRITGLYVLTLIYDDSHIENVIVYDLNELYCVRMNCIKSCNACLDNASQEMLTVLMFREALLRGSIEFNNIEDALQYYSDIFRPFCKKDHPVNMCIGGMCGTNKYRSRHGRHH